jgi:hypothetical protein
MRGDRNPGLADEAVLNKVQTKNALHVSYHPLPYSTQGQIVGRSIFSSKLTVHCLSLLVTRAQIDMPAISVVIISFPSFAQKSASPLVMTHCLRPSPRLLNVPLRECRGTFPRFPLCSVSHGICFTIELAAARYCIPPAE